MFLSLKSSGQRFVSGRREVAHPRLQTRLGVEELEPRWVPSNMLPAGDKLVINAPHVVTAGQNFTVTITAKDKSGNTVSGYNGNLDLTTTGFLMPGGHFEQVVRMHHGVVKMTGPEFLAEALHVTASVGAVKATTLITVNPGPVSDFRVSAPIGVTAGASFAVSLQAEDRYRNLVSDYSGTATLSCGDGQTMYFQGNSPNLITVVNGRGTAEVAVHRADPNCWLGAETKDGKVTGGTSVEVDPGPPASFTISAPSTVSVGVPFTATVTAKDAYGNTTSGSNDDLTCSDGQPADNWVDSGGEQVDPAHITWANGVGSATVLLNTADTVTLGINESGITATSNSITVTPDWFSTWVSDRRLQRLARWDYVRDVKLTFTDWKDLFNAAIDEAQNANPNDPTLSNTLSMSLENLAANPGGCMNTIPYVGYLADKVAEPTNNDLGNLLSLGVLPYQPGNTRLEEWAAQEQALVTEWFLGGAHPSLKSGDGSSYNNVTNVGLFSSNPNDTSPSVGTPYYWDVFQGRLGDCTVMASVAEVAGRRPDIIRSMFIYDGAFWENGVTVNVWTLRFYEGAAPRYVTVDSELPVRPGKTAGGTLYDHPENDLWAALAEKGYAQLNGEGWLETVDSNGNDSATAGQYSYAALDSGNAATMMQALAALTGWGAHGFDFGGLGQPKASDMANELQSGNLVVLGTPNSTPSQLVNNHCYAVLAYDGSKAQPFTLFNPWGLKNGVYPYPSQYSNAYDLFTADGDYLNSNFNDAAHTGHSAMDGDNGNAAPSSKAVNLAAQGDTLGVSPGASNPMGVLLPPPAAVQNPAPGATQPVALGLAASTRDATLDTVLAAVGARPQGSVTHQGSFWGRANPQGGHAQHLSDIVFSALGARPQDRLTHRDRFLGGDNSQGGDVLPLTFDDPADLLFAPARPVFRSAK
jgi:hypothetical protein